MYGEVHEDGPRFKVQHAAVSCRRKKQMWQENQKTSRESESNRAEVFRGGHCTLRPQPTTGLTISASSEAHPFIIEPLIAPDSSIHSITASSLFFRSPFFCIYLSLTHSLFTQGSLQSCNHWPCPSTILSPSRSLCQRALHNLQIPFSFVFLGFPHIPQCFPSPSIPVFFFSEGKLILIILSPLSLAHPPPPVSLSLHDLSFSLSLCLEHLR